MIHSVKYLNRIIHLFPRTKSIKFVAKDSNYKQQLKTDFQVIRNFDWNSCIQLEFEEQDGEDIKWEMFSVKKIYDMLILSTVDSIRSRHRIQSK